MRLVAKLILIWFAALRLLSADGDVLSVTVETNGWQAKVVLQGMSTGGTYGFGISPSTSYSIPTNATLTLNWTSQGFDQSGNATTVARSAIGTSWVRLPYPNASSKDETVVSTTNVQLRIALSDYIYSGDSNVTATILAGLYVQGGDTNQAVTGFAVTSTSAISYPKPVANWSRPPLDVVRSGHATLAVVGFGHHATGGKPLQCVQFWVADEDGTKSATNTVTTATIDSDYGDATPVIEYVGRVSLAGLSSSNLLTGHFRAFPRIGDSDSILDTSTHGFSFPSHEAAPTQLLGDMDGLYGGSVAVVAVGSNDVNGVAVSLSSYNSASPPAAFGTMAGAVTAIVRTNYTLFGRADPGGSTIYLRAGNHAFAGGTATITNQARSWLTIENFTGESPEITSSSGAKALGDKVKIKGITFNCTTSSAIDNTGYLWIDQCTMGSGNSTASLIDTVTNTWFTRCTVGANMAQGLGPTSVSQNQNWRMVRGNTFDLSGEGIWPSIVLGNYRNSGTNGAVRCSVGFFGGTLTDIERPSYPIIAFNRLMGEFSDTAGSDMIGLFPPTADYESTNGLAVVQNVIEFLNGTNGVPRCMSIASSVSGSGDTNDTPWAIIWHNTTTGQRCNLLENAGGTTEAAWVTANRLTPSFKNNMMDQAATKDDQHYTACTNGARVGQWAFSYGVNCGGNVDLDPNTLAFDSGGWAWMFYGLSSYPTTNSTAPAILSWPAFVDRKSSTGDDDKTVGFGNYAPISSSPLIRLARDWVLPYDISGRSRVFNGASGAYEYVGTNYYVATDGNDSNTGLVGSPKLTIQAGITLLSPSGGDTLTISNGMYYPASSVTISNINGGPYRTTIQAETRRSVTNWSKGWVCYASNITVDGIAFEQITNTARLDLTAVVLETNSHGFYGINNQFCNFTNVIPNNHYAGYYMLAGTYGTGTNRPYYPFWYYPANCIFSNNVSETVWSGHCYFIMGSNNIVVNNIIRDQANGDAFYLHGVSNVVRGNYVTNCYLSGYGRGTWNSASITTNFIIPSVSNNVTIGVDDSSWMYSDLVLITRADSSHFKVISAPSATTATIMYQNSSQATISVDATAGTFTRSTGTFPTNTGVTVYFSGYANAGNNVGKVVASVTGGNTIITVTDNSGLVTEAGDGNELATRDAARPGATINANTGIGISGGYHPDLFQTFGQSGETTAPWLDSWGHIIERNQFWDCVLALAQLENRDTSTPATYGTEWQQVRLNDWLFRNNLFVRSGSPEGSISSIDIPTSWINNTFVACGTNALSSGEVLGFNYHLEANQLKGAATNSVVINNAFVGCGRTTNGGWWIQTFVSGFPTNSDNFTYYSNLVVHWNGSSWIPKRTTTWVQGTTTIDRIWAADLNSGTDPVLVGWDVGAVAGNYRPMLNSPLIDVGTNTTLVASAFDLMTRPLGTLQDVGCYEYDPNLRVLLGFSRDFVGDYLILDETGQGHDAKNMVTTNWVTMEADAARGPVGVWTATYTNSVPSAVSAYAGITNLTDIEFITNGTVTVWVKWSTNGVGGWTSQGTERWDAILECGYNTVYAANSAEATNSWVLQYGSPKTSETPTGPVFKHYTTGDNNSTNGILARWTQARDENEWHHLAVTWSADTQSFVAYEDGLYSSSATFSAPYLRVSGQASPWIAVGTQTHDGTPQWGDDSYPNFGFLKGRMTDLRIYDRALSADEVAAIVGVAVVAQAGTEDGGEPEPPATGVRHRVYGGRISGGSIGR